MRKLSAALLFLLGLASAALAQGPIVGPGQPILCTQIATMAVGPSTITQVIAPVPNQRIVICGWHVTNTGATGTFSFQTGTGTNCGTGTGTLLPAANVTSTAPSADHIDYGSIQTPIGSALCITPSVATISAYVYFSQF